MKASPLVAILTRTPPTSLLCGMSRDWIFITSGKPARATAASSSSRAVTSTSSGNAMPASRSSDLLSNSDSVADARCAERSRGGIAAASAGGASLKFGSLHQPPHRDADMGETRQHDDAGFRELAARKSDGSV